MQSLEKLLKNPNKRIVNLSLNHCFFDGQALYHLCNGLMVNKTLVTLSLAGNGLTPMCGNELIRAIKVTYFTDHIEQHLHNVGQSVKEQPRRHICLRTGKLSSSE